MKTILTSIFVILSMTLSMATSLPDSINSAPQNTSVVLVNSNLEAFVIYVHNDRSTNASGLDIKINRAGYSRADYKGLVNVGC